MNDPLYIFHVIFLIKNFFVFHSFFNFRSPKTYTHTHTWARIWFYLIWSICMSGYFLFHCCCCCCWKWFEKKSKKNNICFAWLTFFIIVIIGPKRKKKTLWLLLLLLLVVLIRIWFYCLFFHVFQFIKYSSSSLWWRCRCDLYIMMIIGPFHRQWQQQCFIQTNRHLDWIQSFLSLSFSHSPLSIIFRWHKKRRQFS